MNERDEQRKKTKQLREEVDKLRIYMGVLARKLDDVMSWKEEEKTRKEEMRKAPPIPKEEIIHLHKEIEKEQKKKKPSPKTEKKEASSFDPDLYLMTTGQD